MRNVSTYSAQTKLFSLNAFQLNLVESADTDHSTTYLSLQCPISVFPVISQPSGTFASLDGELGSIFWNTDSSLQPSFRRDPKMVTIFFSFQSISPGNLLKLGLAWTWDIWLPGNPLWIPDWHPLPKPSTLPSAHSHHPFPLLDSWYCLLLQEGMPGLRVSLTPASTVAEATVSPALGRKNLYRKTGWA